MGMSDWVYDGLKYVSWECFQFDVPNLSTSIFDTTIIESSNSFSHLSDNATSPDCDISFCYPNATSSPTRPVAQKDARKRNDIPLRIVLVNCQSVKKDDKRAQLHNLISFLQADIVIGN